MRDDLVSKLVRRAAYRLMAVHGMVLLALILGAVFTWRYWKNFFQGPQPVETAQLESVADPRALTNYYVTVSVPKVVDSGWEQSSSLVEGNTVLSKTRVYGYYVAILPHRALLVSSSDDAPQAGLTGALVPIPADVKDDVVAGIQRQAPNLESHLLPFMLDCSNFHESGAWALVVMLPVGLFALVRLKQALTWASFPDTHPDLAVLNRLAGTERLAHDIDAEMSAEASTLTRVGSATLSSHWLVAPVDYGLHVVRLEDVMWVYLHTTDKRGADGGRLYDALLFRRNGQLTDIEGTETFVKDILAALRTRAPWAVQGYSADRRDRWYAQRDVFVDEVDARRVEQPALRDQTLL